MGKRGAALTKLEKDRAKGARSTRANGHWNLTMQTAWGSALTAVEDIAFLQSQWKPAFQIIADRLAEKTDRAFSSGITPDGKSFRPIGKEYARYKNGRAYLYLSGKLRTSATRSSALKSLTNTGLKWHVDLPYATTHQFGSLRNLSKGKRGGFRGARARSFLIWGDDMKDLFKNTLNDYGRTRAAEILRKADRGGR